MKKRIIILVLCLAVLIVVSGCFKKEVKPVVKTINETSFIPGDDKDVSTSNKDDYNPALNKGEILDELEPDNNSIFYNIIKDDRLLLGKYSIPFRAWSPGSKNLAFLEAGPDSDIGIPSYLILKIYNIASNKFYNNSISVDLFASEPKWVNENEIKVKYSKYNFKDKQQYPADVFVKLTDSNLQIEKQEIIHKELLHGFGILDLVKYYNDNTDEERNSVFSLSYSNDKNFAAFYSYYGTGTIYDDFAGRLFVVRKNISSLENIIHLGNTSRGVESSWLPLEWSDNSQFFTNGKELYDISKLKSIIPFEKNAHGNDIRISPSGNKALASLTRQDKREFDDYDHLAIKLYVVDLYSGEKNYFVISEGDMKDGSGYIKGSFSPDEKYLIYPYKKHLWISEIDSGSTQRLTAVENDYVSPRWSPDGKKIIYNISNYYNKNIKKEVRIMVIENNNKQKIEKIATTTEKINYLENGEIDTSNWEVLKDEEWGIQLMYPENWMVDNFNSKEFSTNYAFTSPNYKTIKQGPVENRGEIYFHIHQYEKDLSVLEMIDRFDDTSRFWPQKYEYDEVMIKGNEAIVFKEIDDDETKRKVIFIKNKNRLFSWSYLYEIKNSIVEKVFDKMVSTVKQIN